jgi:transposase
MRKERKHYTAEEKVAVLRRHLLDKVPVSDLCEELGLQPTVFVPLAERVLRERSRRLPIDGASSPPGGGETELPDRTHPST